MAGLGALIVHALWLLLPAYLSNMLPVLVGGGPPVDGGRTWKDGRRVFGDGKTWRGLLLAPPLAAGVFTAVDVLVPAGYPFVDLAAAPPWTFAFALALGYGALVGDLAESFAKRRLGKERGAPWLGFDQLDFVIGAWAFGVLASLLLLPFYGTLWFPAAFPWPVLLMQVVLTPLLHLAVNFIGYKLKLKEVPW